jgi:dienelactone hydrolase
MKNLFATYHNGIEIIHTDQNRSYSNFIIFICGGGKEIGAIRFKEWQAKLLNQNIGSLSFNFMGVENSKGDMREDSLKNRTKTLKSVVDYVRQNFDFEILNFYGVSMGGFTLLDYLNKNHVNEKIILQAPAAYSTEAHNKKFNSDFSKIIRKTDSWKTSKTFSYLEKNENKVLLIILEKDDVIPIGIINKYSKIVSNKAKSEILLIKDAPHSIWSDTNKNNKVKDGILKNIIKFTQTKN